MKIFFKNNFGSFLFIELSIVIISFSWLFSTDSYRFIVNNEPTSTSIGTFGMNSVTKEVEMLKNKTKEEEIPQKNRKLKFHEALYFTLVTFTTVGYGDIIPATPLTRYGVICLLLCTIGNVFFAIPLYISAIFSREK